MSLLDAIGDGLRGLFGSSARNYADTVDDASAAPDLTLKDRAAIFSAALDDPAKAALLRQKLASAPVIAAAQKDIADFAAGRPIAPRPAAVPAYQPDAAPSLAPAAQAAQTISSDLSPELGGQGPALADHPIAGTDFSGVIPQRAPIADRFGKALTIQNALPLLLRARARGVDIKQYLDAFKAARPDFQHVETPGFGASAFDPSNGTFTPGVREPIRYKADENLYLPDDGSGAPPAAAPAEAVPAAPSVILPTDAGGGLNVRGVRNNNPLNLSNLPNGHIWDGQTGSDGQYAVFATPEAGFAAADQNLQAYHQRHGIDTVAGIVNRWAPQAGGNDPAAYAATVSQALGVRPDQKLDLGDPNVRRQVLTAMSGVELGQPIRFTQGADAPAAPTLAGQAGADTVPPQIPGFRLLHAAEAAGGYHKATPQELTALGYPADAHIIIDPKGKPIAAPSGAESGDLEPTLQGLTGDNLITKLTPAEGAQVKALAEGRMPFPSSFAISKPYWQRMLQLVSQYDPSFNAADYQSRAKTRADFTSGKSAQNITALNTVIGHLNDLDKAIDGLGNYSIPLNNYVAHKIAGATGTDSRVKTFQNAKTAVANELTRVFRGTGGAEADIKAWQSQLDDASSPASLRAVVHSMASLINSRLEALGEQYNQGMGHAQDPLRLLTPDKAAAFARMRDGYGPHDPQAKAYTPQSIGATTAGQSGETAEPSAQAPVRVRNIGEAARLAPGTLFVTPDGRTLRRK
jgi:hypothetical protein